jgi:putative transposase
VSFEPQKFFIGLIDFFSILMPGALLAYLGRRWAANTTYSWAAGPLDTAEAWMVFLFASLMRSSASKVIRTPVKAPRANPYAERWVRTVRTGCLDWFLIRNERHLERVLRVYVHHYNAERPHRGLKLSPPEGPREPMASAVQANVCRRDLLGGLLHEYYQAAA